MVVGRLFTALAPGGRDAQLYGYVGLQWTRGHIPYIGTWENKPPGIFALNAIGFKFFGPSFKGLAAFEGICLFALLIAIYALLRQWDFPKLLALAAVVACAVGTNLAYYNQGGNLTEIYLLFPATLSMYFFALSNTGTDHRHVFLAGLCSGVAALMKPVGIAPLLAQTVFLLLLAFPLRKISWKHSLGIAAINIIGTVAAWIPAVIYFGLHGALGGMMEASITYNIHYAVHSGFNPRVLVLIIVLFRPLAIFCAFTIVGFLYYPVQLKREQTDISLRWLLVILWVVFDIAGAMAGGRYYEHYFLSVVPSLSVASVFGLVWLLNAIPENSFSLKYAILTLLFVPLLISQVQDGAHWTRTREEIFDVATQPMVDWLRKTPGSDATLFVWPFRPSIYFRTGLNNSTKYLSASYMYSSPRAYREIGPQLVSQLQEHPPTYIVDCNPSCAPPDYEATDPVRHEFQTILHNNYNVLFTSNGLTLYEMCVHHE